MKSVDMTDGPIWPLLISFTLPLLVGNLFQLLYNTVDSIVVGNFVSTEALAAVGATTQICNSMVKFFNGVSIGAGAVISQCFGSKNKKKLEQAVHTTMSLTLIACVAMTIIGCSASDWMLRRMSTPDDVFQDASIYLRIYFSGVSGLLIYNIGGAILRAVGDTRRPLLFLLLCSGLNIVLDLLFVLVFQWGITGVAVATVISQMISAILILIVLSRSAEDYRLDLRKLCLTRSLISPILAIGLPVGMQQSIIGFSNVFVQSYINVFGSSCMAGWSCYSKLDQYMMLPMQSLGQAATTFTGQNLGAGKLDRAKKGTWVAFGICLFVTSIAAVMLHYFAPELSALFTKDASVIAYGAGFIRLCAPFAILCTFNQVLSGTLRGAGDSRGPMLLTLCSHVFIRQIYLFIISRIFPDSVKVIAFGYPFGWILCAIIMTIYYRFSGWEKKCLQLK